MNVLVTGGTGLVGTRLVRHLRGRGDAVTVVSRRSDAWRKVGTDVGVVPGDPSKPGDWLAALDAADAVVHLAGEPILARRWDDAFFAKQRASRVASTEIIAARLAARPRRADGSPRAYVGASAIGFYPDAGGPYTEESPPGDGPLARLCVDWERAARPAWEAGVRVAVARIGVVLDPRGGALGQMLTPFRLGLGGPAGTGDQGLSWVHRDDLTRLFAFLLDRPDAEGPYNGTAPNPVTNREFARALGRALARPAVLPAPAFAVRLLFGDAADAVLKGAKVVPERTVRAGFAFRFPELSAALSDLTGAGASAAP